MKFLIFDLNDAIFLSELMEEIELGHLPQGGTGHSCKERKGVHCTCVVRELWEYLQCECGEGEALPNNVFHDVMPPGRYMYLYLSLFIPSNLDWS